MQRQQQLQLQLKYQLQQQQQLGRAVSGCIAITVLLLHYIRWEPFVKCPSFPPSLPNGQVSEKLLYYCMIQW